MYLLQSGHFTRFSLHIMLLREKVARYIDTHSALYRYLFASKLRPLAKLVFDLLVFLQLAIVHIYDRFCADRQRSDPTNCLTIIIKTFERPRTVRRLIASIRYYYPKIRIVVADDSYLSTPLDEADVIRLPFDSGVGKGRIAALNAVNTEYFVNLDDDFIFYSGTDLIHAVSMLNKYPEIDLIGGGLINLPLLRRSGRGGNIGYCTVPALVPSGIRIGGLEVCDKVPQFYVARTAKVRALGWDPDIKCLDHLPFFNRARGVLLTVFSTKMSVLHARTPFDAHYAPKRYDLVGDRKVINERYKKRSETIQSELL
jgi:glycosyltransferase involved in cell wall biosynthesis